MEFPQLPAAAAVDDRPPVLRPAPPPPPNAAARRGEVRVAADSGYDPADVDHGVTDDAPQSSVAVEQYLDEGREGAVVSLFVSRG